MCRDNRGNVHAIPAEDVNPLVPVTDAERIVPKESDKRARRDQKRRRAAALPRLDLPGRVCTRVTQPGQHVPRAGQVD